MTKIFLDTNIWIRLFLKDTPQYESVEKLINLVEEGKFLTYSSSIVLLEVSYVLEKSYKLSPKQVLEYLRAITKTRNITTIDQTNSLQALNYFYKLGVKFSDCLIASQIPKDMILVTFDKDFKKFGNLKVSSPSGILS